MRAKLGFIAAGAVALIGLVGYVTVPYWTVDTVTVNVTKTDRVCSSGVSENCKYLVFTDNEVLEIVDEWARFKFNSSDIYSKITEGKPYDFKVSGFRVPFFSMYRNIHDVKPL